MKTVRARDLCPVLGQCTKLLEHFRTLNPARGLYCLMCISGVDKLEPELLKRLKLLDLNAMNEKYEKYEKYEMDKKDKKYDEQ